MAPPLTLTPEQIAKAAERKAAKLAKKAAKADGTLERTPEQRLEEERRRFLKRDWISVGSGSGDDDGSRRVRIITWNILAQTLVRRELFPGSDCLRWSERRPLMQAELEHHSANDIICLQECDRLRDYLSSLPKHSHVKGSGPGKLHGLVILYRADRFFVRGSRLVHLDQEDLTPQPTTKDEDDSQEIRKRRGGSRQTKNVGLIAALEDVNTLGRGIVIVTTHLFWHPKYAYERVRQCIILLRAIRQFQQDNNCSSWPVVFAGDLNTQPSEATYQLLVNPHKPLPPSMVDEINSSRLVHDSVQKVPLSNNSAVPQPPSLSGTGANTPIAAAASTDSKEKDDDEEELPDSNEKSIANTRTPEERDGMLTADELISLARQALPEEGARSAYGSTSWSNEESFGQRAGFANVVDAEGGGEPAYTCFTPLFRLTLDYLLILPPVDGGLRAEVTGLLAPPRIEQLGKGLPRKGICASDHLAVGCEISW
ncbi:hypothetical protein CI109_102053 [Kwoniella shandongensis]|uniref:Endonuclease/exonuclease/phosphatase domain-containing protein n=1 Tax=Kwoniella shandongensis TaxID=1734106 RepID=A0A5M6BQL0_9TREE|nr:uncharacterized protein CI109_006538 [Kwoniella shandongensis]KAA5525168.1 hypothetical protein CI109_006538 [Kwoniella shandongensis]